METPRSPERDACVREEVYARAKLSETTIREIEFMVAESPARDVGGGALRNVVTIRNSHKSSRPIFGESHTCESIFHNLCDIDQNVLAFYSQIRLRNVQRPKGNGFHVSNATIDVLAFHTNDIRIIECKHLDTLDKLVQQQHKDWALEDGHYVHIPYRNWASQRNLIYETYSPPVPFARYQSNIEALRAVLDSGLSDSDHTVISRVVALCAERGPQSAAAVCAQIPGCTRRHIMHGLVAKLLVGTLMSESLDSDRFIIGLPGTGVEEMDRHRLDAIAILQQNPVVHDEFLVHPPKYRDIAVKRLNRIIAMREGKEDWTRRYKDLSDHLEAIGTSSIDMLRHLLPNYASCGNRGERLSPAQISVLDKYAKRWQQGKYSQFKVALADYRKKCERLGISPVSDTTLRAKFKTTDPAKRAFATEGFRGYQRTRPRTSPLNRSNPALLPGHTVHVDSTALDVRSGPLKEFEIPAERAWIYVARDSGGKPLSRAFLLGNARTDGLDILWRTYVYRNGELPRLVHIDRGSENRSTWHKSFVKGTFDLRVQPTANAQSNQPAEDLLNHINSNVSHWLIGNTLPDRMGRSVDGKFKSIKTARLAIHLICQYIDDYLFDEMVWTRKIDGGTVNEDYERRRLLFGMGGGKPWLYDDEFLIKTSVPVKKYKWSEKDGISTTDGKYLNDEMQFLLRRQRPDQVLRDCIDPSILSVQIKERWFRALRSDAWKMQDLSLDERLTYLMTERAATAINRSEREVAHKNRHRAMRAEMQRSINESQAPSPPNSNSAAAPAVKPQESQLEDNSLADSEPYDEI